jgi:hypothetical protein
MYSGRTDVNNLAEHRIRISALLHEHRPRCMVIDPLSAISRTGALNSARAIGNRLIKSRGTQHSNQVSELALPVLEKRGVAPISARPRANGWKEPRRGS